MRFLFIILLVWSEFLTARQLSRAVIFIDSASPGQASLIAEINQMLFYSPTLRSQLQVEVFDINRRAAVFAGGLTYNQDKNGQALAQYRPESLPFLICLHEKTVGLRIALENKEQVCLCLQKC